MAGGHSAGVMIETNPAKRGTMDFQQLQVPSFLLETLKKLAAASSTL